MACGCIPIASNGGGMPEAVGKAGFVFQRGKLDDMVAVITTALTDAGTIVSLRRQATPHLEAHLSDIVSQKYFELIQQAAAG
jgi:glycosyltransferase involved in cell wall biosynthesis